MQRAAGTRAGKAADDRRSILRRQGLYQGGFAALPSDEGARPPFVRRPGTSLPSAIGGTVASTDTRGCPFAPGAISLRRRARGPARSELRAATGHVAERRIWCDDQVERLHRGRRVEEILELFTNARHSETTLHLAKLVEAVDALEAEELDARNPRDALELGEAKRPFAIAPVRRISLPRDADLESSLSVQVSLSLPVAFESGVGAQVGYASGHGLEGGSERERQAHDRSEDREFWQKRSFGNDFVHARTRREQPGNWFLTGKDHVAAAVADQRRVANELNRVAKSVVGVEQDRSALEGTTVPPRLRRWGELQTHGT